MIRTVLLIAILICLPALGNAQTVINYGYDDAGNRV